MESLKELYRIGPGPSSSHTLGVRNACLYYINKYDKDEYTVTLYGSLALTGRGHMSDKIIEDTFKPKKVTIIFKNESYDENPNTMVFEEGTSDELVIYSTGGGAIKVKGVESIVDSNVYPHNSLNSINEFCLHNDLDYAGYTYCFEPNIKEYLLEVAKQMIAEIDNGLASSGDLPGPLKLKRVAASLNNEAKKCSDETIKEKLFLSSYAYAALEENACGKIVVTAPTLGSCGVLSSILYKYYKKGFELSDLADALAVAGLFGNLIKTNASISGAVGGCQAEIGSATAMASAFASYLEKLPAKSIEYAAEIAIEHNLGLTCDPVGGYVQVPCIERNGIGALRAIDSMLYAKYLSHIKDNIVSFDMIVETMKYTGQKIAMELKETSLGGLAEVVPCKKPEGC